MNHPLNLSQLSDSENQQKTLSFNSYLCMATTNRVWSYQASGSPAHAVDEIGTVFGCTTMWIVKALLQETKLFIFVESTAGDFVMLMKVLPFFTLLCFLRWSKSKRSQILRPCSPELYRHRCTSFLSNCLFNLLVLYVALSANATESESPNFEVTVFDPENRLVAFLVLSKGVREIISEWGQIFILTSAGKVGILLLFRWLEFQNSHHSHS